MMTVGETACSNGGDTGAQLAQVSTIIPPDSKPGETMLEVEVPHDTENERRALQFRVPPGAKDGDRLIFTKYEKLGWTCGLAKGRITGTIVAPIPPDAQPGVTEIPIRSADGYEIMRPRVPPAARPGVDEFHVKAGVAGFEVSLAVDQDDPKSVRDMAVAASQASLRAPPRPADEAYGVLADAVRAAGGFVTSKMVRGRAPPLNIPGMIAAEPIAEGEEICRIPERVHVSPQTTDRYLPEMWAAVGAQELMEVCKARWKEAVLFALVALMLQEAEDRAVLRRDGCESGAVSDDFKGLPSEVREVWSAYMDQLLAEDFEHHPIRKTAADPDEVRNHISPCTMTVHLLKESKTVHTLFRLVQKAGGDGWTTRVQKGMFFRAMLCFQSRQFKAAVSNSGVPVADLINHATGPMRGVVWRYDEDAQAHVLTAVRPHAAGEELFQSYGDHANTCLYRCYGFTQAPDLETKWTFSLWAELVPTLFAKFVPQGSPAYHAEIALSTAEVSDGLRDLLAEIAATGQNPAFFLRMVCAELMKPFQKDVKLLPALVAFRRVRAADPTSAEWWTGLAEADRGLLNSEPIRLQMSEYVCLTAVAETVSLAAGEAEDIKCLALAGLMRRPLVTYISALYSKYPWQA